jgi:uncharacterized membrane protein YgdD (TMEM256/DUF423 family)
MTQSENRTGEASPARASSSSRASRWPIAFSGFSGAVSVAAGAFAAHGLNPVAQAAQIGWLHTGAQYQALHALAILATAIATAAGLASRRWAVAAQLLFVFGSILFPAALYGLTLGGPRWLGAIAPLGGASFILGWIALAIGALKTDH